jgi:hypothetical protein
MGDMIYLAAGYAVFWLVSFVFIYSLISRQRNIQKDLAMLDQLVQEDQERQSNS